MLKGYLVPHPPLIVNGIGKGDEIPATKEAYKQIAEEIKLINPQTVVIISPHSVMYSDYIHIAPGGGAKGDFGAFGVKNIKFEAGYDSELTSLIEKLAKERGIHAGALGEKSPVLDHGVMVPLYFIKAERIVRISISGLSVTEHYKLGMCIADAIKRLKRNAVIIASGDMSHKLKADGPYGFAPEGPEFDNFVCDCIRKGGLRELLSIEPSLCESAAECGYKSIVMLLGAFDGIKTDCRLLSYEGPFGVGYLTASFTANGETESLLSLISADKQKKLEKIRASESEYVRIARQNVENFVLTGKKISGGQISQSMLNSRAGVFVSIKKDGMLRGCIGTIRPAQKNIYEEILENGISAASRDPRFDPVEENELDSLVYSVDILSPAEPISSKAELDVNRYGVIARYGRRSGLLLPALEGVNTVDEQISIALRKAGINQDEPYSLERFEVVRHK